MARWLRKKHLRERYSCCDRTIDRMVESGRLPAPQFPWQNRIPGWEEAVLDTHDRAVVAGGSKREAA